MGADEGATILHDGACSAPGPRASAAASTAANAQARARAETARPASRLGLEDEDVDPVLREFAALMELPRWLRGALAAASAAAGWRRMALILGESGRAPVQRLYALTARAQALRRRVALLMERRGLDVLLTPAMAMPPCAAGEGAKNPSACNYTALWNLLDFPAGVLPAYTATADDVGDRLREWRRDEGRGAAGGLGLPNDPWGQKVGAASGDAGASTVDGLSTAAPSISTASRFCGESTGSRHWRWSRPRDGVAVFVGGGDRPFSVGTGELGELGGDHEGRIGGF